MSFLSDLVHGDFGNLGHDISADPIARYAVPALGVAGLGLATGGFGLLGGAAEGGGLLGGLFGGGEAAAAGTEALGFAGEGAADAGLSSFLADPLAAGGLSGGADAGLTGDLAFGGAIPGGVASPTGIASGDAAFAGAAGGDVSGLSGAAAAGGAAPGGVAPGALGGAAGAAPGAAGAPAGGGGFLDSLISGASKSITSNPLGTAAAGIGLGANLLKGPSAGPNQQALTNAAGQLGAQGQWLQQYLTNGTLPPAMKAQLDQATAAAKARIVSNHAANGMSTDPNQNSALAQELSAADTNAVAAMAQAQIQMMNTGLNATGLSTQLYGMLTQMDRQDNQQLMQSIASFAAALGGGNKGVSLKLA